MSFRVLDIVQRLADTNFIGKFWIVASTIVYLNRCGPESFVSEDH